jgi:hypothetical protein
MLKMYYQVTLQMQSRFAEISCPICCIDFKIKLESDEYIPDMSYLCCPICGSLECKANWIDHDKTHYNNNGKKNGIK